MRFSAAFSREAFIFMLMTVSASINGEAHRSEEPIARGESFGGGEGFRGDERSMPQGFEGHNDFSHSNSNLNRGIDGRNNHYPTRNEALRYGENQGFQRGIEDSAGVGYQGNTIYAAPPVQYAPNGNPYSPSGNDNWGQ